MADMQTVPVDAVRMSGISKKFGVIQALQHVNLCVQPGEIHGLLGENGAGKSTLLKILCGVETPDTGTIEINGKRLAGYSPQASRRAGVAMAFQEMSLVPTLNVAQNIFLNREPRSRSGLIDDHQAVEQARALLDSFGVNIDPTSPVSHLGPSQRQLTEILKAVSQETQILILDEPTSALSAAEVESLFSVLRRLKAQGVTIIYVSHRIEEVIRIANRATIMRDGRHIITAPLSDLTPETIFEYIIGPQLPGFSIRESEQKFRHLADNIREVFWMIDPRTQRILYVSPAYEQIWGRAFDGLYPHTRLLLETVHHEDRPRVVAAYESEIATQAGVEHEYRIVRPDGSVRWIWDRGFPVRDDTGQVYRVVRITEDITERKRVEEELQHSFEQLRALAARLQSVREEERTRVAREIHDELGQALTAIKIDLSSWIRELPPAVREQSKRAAPIVRLIDQTIQLVRRISTELRPGILDDLGLVAAVEWAAEEFEARTGTKCHLVTPQRDIVIDRERATALFRIFQETLTNVARHAEATQLHVWLVEDEGAFLLEVRDNGKGFTDEPRWPGKSLGILGMRERALLLGGELTIRGAPGKGTTVRARIPDANRSRVRGND